MRFEIATATPQRIENRVSERICVCFGTWEATNVNISLKFRNSRCHDRPWPCKVSCQTNVPRHHTRTKMLSKRVSTNWRTEIAYDFQDPELWIKTHFCHPKFLSAFSGFDSPGLEQYYFDERAKPSLQVISVSILLASTPREPEQYCLDGKAKQSLQVVCNWKCPRRRRKALKFASANEFAYFSVREGPPAWIFHEIFEIPDCMTDLGLLMPNKCSQTPPPDKNVKQTCLYTLTDGYCIRFSGSKAMNQHVFF